MRHKQSNIFEQSLPFIARSISLTNTKPRSIKTSSTVAFRCCRPIETLFVGNKCAACIFWPSGRALPIPWCIFCTVPTSRSAANSWLTVKSSSMQFSGRVETNVLLSEDDYRLNRVFAVVTFAMMAVGRSMAMIPDYSKGKQAALRIMRLHKRQSEINPNDDSGIILVRPFSTLTICIGWMSFRKTSWVTSSFVMFIFDIPVDQHFVFFAISPWIVHRIVPQP